ncbi:MAG: hopanoid C-3 methylase HpnR [Deltaproteobacteria bacterium]|nr:MAG: hopanoid C-3 methylase HpnR [Deltaproteobacteria bacterium]
MKILLVHPSPLMHAEIFLRLEPLGLERVGQALRSAGHHLSLLDLQVLRHKDYFRELNSFRPQALGFSLNYLPNVPEVVDLAIETRRRLPGCFIFVGGHSASFIAADLIDHARGAIDCVVRGEGEAIAPRLLEHVPDGKLESLPGIVTPHGSGPPPILTTSLDEPLPARDLTRKRKKYFIGQLDPCASVEFTRGCPWDCSFCSGWTFYGRTYRKASPEAIAEDLSRVREPNVFIVDDVAFIRPDHALAVGKEIEKRGIQKQYYLETRCDVLIRNREVFSYWKRLGLKYMFLGFEAIDEEVLKLYRKRISLDDNFQALEIAQDLGIMAAINLIADPDWDEKQFQLVRQWAESVPAVVNLTVSTPYPGTETWYTESRKLTTLDYRLFDVQHAVLPTRLPLMKFYEELVKTQAVLNRKYMGLAAVRKASSIVLGHLFRGQTNFLKMIWKFNRVFNPERLHNHHFRAEEYALQPPPPAVHKPTPEELYVHLPLEKGTAHS